MQQHGWILPERLKLPTFPTETMFSAEGIQTDLRSQDADWEAAASGLFETSPCTSSEHCFVPATKSSQMGTNHLGMYRYIYHLHNVYVHVCTMFALLCTVFTPLRVGSPPTPQVYFGPWEGAKGGFPPWGLPKLRIFHFPPPWGLPKLGNFHFSPRGAPQAREFSLSPRGGLPKLGNFHFPPVGAPQAREFFTFPPWGHPKLGNFHFSPPWGLPKLGNFHFSPPWQLPSYGIFTFPSLGGSPSCGISNS